MRVKNMKTGTKLIFSLLLLAIFLFPESTFAYKTVDQKTVKINDNSVLYTITYRFGFLNREAYMPIGAVRGVENGSSSPYVGYDILNNGSVIDSGKTGALVLSGADVKDSQYYLSEGKVANFTLMTILTFPEGIKNTDALALKINHLPFIMVNDGDAGRTFLHERELEPYITPSITGQ